MKNLKVSKKLFISYALILVFLIAGCIVSVADLLRLGEQIETFYHGPFTVNGSANIINSNFEKMQKAVYRSIANTDPQITKEAVADARDAAAIIEEQIPVVETHFLGDQEIIARLKDALTKLAPMREKVLELGSENRSAEATEYMEHNNILVIQEAQAELNLLVENGNRKGEELITGLKDRQYSAIVTIILLGSFSVTTSAFFGIYISRGIIRPVEELEKAARTMAAGNLSDVLIAYQSEDELGMLADDMRSMITVLTGVIQDETVLLKEMSLGNFNVRSKREDCYIGEFKQLLQSMRGINRGISDTLLRIHLSADEVASNSEQVSTGAQVLAQGTTEQAASVEELSCSINDISKRVGENAENAREANIKSRKVKENAQESSRCMQEMLSAMKEISACFDEIGRIFKTIEDIAHQTNILALNAAVEAARAGSQGKGLSLIHI